MNAGREKVEREGKCRVCGEPNPDAAHIWPKSLGGEGYDDPDNIVPLCKDGGCHLEFDARQIGLLPYLTRDEEVACVKLAGIARAYRRLTAR